jgi:hypothetical protein
MKPATTSGAAVTVLYRMAVFLTFKEDCECRFACNNGPNLRTLLDSAAIYPHDQRIYCVYQTFDTETRELALKTLGQIPLDTNSRPKEDADHLLLVRVTLPDAKSITVSNGKVTLHHNELCVGIYNPHKRYGRFYPGFEM